MVSYTENFLAATRGAGAAEITTGNYFDFHKLAAKSNSFNNETKKNLVVELSEAAHSVETLFTQSQITFPRPEFSNHYIFNGNKFTRSQLDIIQIRNAYVSVNIKNFGAPEFYIFDENRNLINGLFFGANPFLDEVDKVITEPSVLIDDFFVKPNICHFIYDKIPRGICAGKNGHGKNFLLFYDFPYATEFAEFIDHTVDFVVGTKRRATVFVEHLVCFSNSFSGLCHPARFAEPAYVEILDSIRNKAVRKSSDAKQKIFITRRDGLPRSIVNSAEVKQLVAQFGFKEIDAEDYSFAEQARIFSEAQIVVGVHGAGLSNLVFMPRESSLIELLPPLCATKAYWLMATAMGIGYTPLICEDPEFGVVEEPGSIIHNSAFNRRDVVVPIDALERTLKTVLGGH